MSARDSIFYFAYGSNMAVERLIGRIPAAEKIGTAKLAGYCLQFHKVSQDGSGKCDIVPDRTAEAIVYGVLFRLYRADLAVLDKVEGRGYKRIDVSVTADILGTVAAATYVAKVVDASLLPYAWYKQHVVRGAIAGRLPAAYITWLESIPCIEDPDRSRHARELAIYGK